MSSHSTKTAGRSSKTARRTDKKTSKSGRAEIKKASKTARRPVGKAARPSSIIAIRAPSIAPKSAAKMTRAPSPPVQPTGAHDIAIMAHKYRVGETVYYTSPTFGRAAASGSYTVVKLLPSEGDDYQYRIKSSGEAFERVAKESQLDRI